MAVGTGPTRTDGPRRVALQHVDEPFAGATAAAGVAEAGPADGRRRRGRSGPRARTVKSRRPAVPVLLASGLWACLAYAAFDRGATGIPAETRLQVALAALALLAAVAAATRRLAIDTSRAGWIALGALGGFAVFSGLSLLWTVAPEASWLETNRVLAYALALGLALAVGSRLPRAIERAALAWLVIATAVALYALGGKVWPGLRLPLLGGLDHTAVFSRLRAPLLYWNALALVCVLGIAVAVGFVTDARRTRRVRLASLAALQLFVVVGGLTYSRGGVLAAAAVALALTLLGRNRVRTLAVCALGLLAAVAPLAVAFSSHALTTDGASHASRAAAGGWLALAYMASLAALLVAAGRLAALEPAVVQALRSARAARSRRAPAVVATAAATAAIAVLALAGGPGGLAGSVSREIDGFTTVRKDPITDPARLLSTSSGNRWVWWLEAAGAFADRPVAGWGAGSFPVTHLLYRKPPPLPVKQPHNVPLQWLAETGLIGALLAVGAIGALLAAAVARVRALRPGRERDLALACLVAGGAWALHCVYDWDWDIPGVTLPALTLLGVVAARPADRKRDGEWVDGRSAGYGRLPEAAGDPATGFVARGAGLALATLALCAYTMSALLPAWAQSRATSALTSIGPASGAGALARAATTADLATRLDPLSSQGSIAAAAIAARRGLPAEERRYLLQAVRREPFDGGAWFRLATAMTERGDRAGALAAAGRLAAVDPLSSSTGVLLAQENIAQAPPEASATATGTPLP